MDDDQRQRAPAVSIPRVRRNRDTQERTQLGKMIKSKGESGDIGDEDSEFNSASVFMPAGTKLSELHPSLKVVPI